MRKIFLVSLLLFLLTAFGSGAAAQEEEGTTLIPIGGFYLDTFPGFVEQAIEHAQHLGSDRVYILMMPMSFTYDPVGLPTANDLVDNTQASERRRRQLEDECRAQTDELYCQVVVPPIYNREGAFAEYTLDYFADDLAAVYFLGGDQTYAMMITAGSPLEDALRAAYESGVPMGGNSAGLAILSRVMIGGYGGDEFGPENALRAGAVDLWSGQDGAVGEETVSRRGLDFGAQSVILEQHFWERARIARLLNAIAQPDVPHIGIGVDSLTGALLKDDAWFGDVFGVYGAAVLDAETLGAVATASFESGVLSARNILFHLLAPGDFSYDIETRQPSWVNATGVINRDWSAAFALPEGAGMLMLHSNLTAIVAEEASSFANAAAIITGYASAEAADAVAALYDGSGVEVIRLVEGDALPDLSAYGMIIVHGGDQSLINVEQLAPVKAAWSAGAMLMLDDAAAAVAGQFYAAHAPTPYDSDDDALIEQATQASFIIGSTETRAGLGLINVNIEPSVMDDNRWGRFVALAYQHPETLTVALNDDAILTIDPAMGGAMLDARSSNGVVTLDLAGAALAEGDNGYMVIGNGVIDVFAPGDMVAPSNP